METIKNYTGTDPAIRDAFLELEGVIGDMENADLADGSTFDCSDAVKAMNVLLDALNR